MNGRRDHLLTRGIYFWREPSLNFLKLKYSIAQAAKVEIIAKTWILKYNIAQCETNPGLPIGRDARQ